MEGIGGGRVNEVRGEDGGDENKWVHPCMSEGEVFPSAEEAAGFSTFGYAGNFGLGVALEARISTMAPRGVAAPTGDSGGEEILCMGSNVETAGAPVSPLISAPSPVDFRRGRGIAPLDLVLLLCRLWFCVLVIRSGKSSTVRDIVRRIRGQSLTTGHWMCPI